MLVQRGAAPALHISRKKGSFSRPPHVRDFVKRRVLFCTEVQSMGGENPLTIQEIYSVTPEVTGLPTLLPLYRQRIIKSEVKICVPVHPMSVF